MRSGWLTEASRLRVLCVSAEADRSAVEFVRCIILRPKLYQCFSMSRIQNSSTASTSRAAGLRPWRARERAFWIRCKRTASSRVISFFSTPVAARLVKPRIDHAAIFNRALSQSSTACSHNTKTPQPERIPEDQPLSARLIIRIARPSG